MSTMTKIIGSVSMAMIITAGLYFGPSVLAGSDPDVSRTHNYLKKVEKLKSAQNDLNSFLANEQKKCAATTGQLQLTNQGVLACVITPKAPEQPAAPPTPPTSPKK